jgi:hypothetical protein
MLFLRTTLTGTRAAALLRPAAPMMTRTTTVGAALRVQGWSVWRAQKECTSHTRATHVVVKQRNSAPIIKPQRPPLRAKQTKSHRMATLCLRALRAQTQMPTRRTRAALSGTTRARRGRPQALARQSRPLARAWWGHLLVITAQQFTSSARCACTLTFMKRTRASAHPRKRRNHPCAPIHRLGAVRGESHSPVSVVDAA